jgi:uncharacterized membrane protein
MGSWLDALLATLALAAALAVRPWRALPAAGPPWPWLAWWALLPLLWTADRLSAMPLALALPGSGLLMLMCGWPLAVLALAPVAGLGALLAGLPIDEALHRFVWLGLAPATIAMALGAAIRRWLPNHLFVYILGRGFFATALANMVAGVAAAALQGPPAGTSAADLMLARGLVAWGDAFIAGMMVAIFVAFRPQWLATYADRIYLPITQEPEHGPR